MFVDACAIVSVLTEEDTSPAYETELARASAPFTSSLAAWEAVMILARADKADCGLTVALEIVLAWLDRNAIQLRELDRPRDLLAYAVAVAEKHGIGKRALSNIDCFHYAHAKAAGAPLLTLDRLLRETDVETLPVATTR
ncbi:MAG: type II toxin-antitoxin system VapC family toxin [Phenylobacterium sp.]|nr:type II toxin-antitoxin system VapC family toxin [Phenylobacterium sp.]